MWWYNFLFFNVWASSPSALTSYLLFLSDSLTSQLVNIELFILQNILYIVHIFIVNVGHSLYLYFVQLCIFWLMHHNSKTNENLLLTSWKSCFYRVHQLYNNDKTGRGQTHWTLSDKTLEDELITVWCFTRLLKPFRFRQNCINVYPSFHLKCEFTNLRYLTIFFSCYFELLLGHMSE